MKYFIKTFGCQLNFSDSERIATLLESWGFTPSHSIDGSDLVIFNTCGVRQTAEDRAYGQIHNLHKIISPARIIVTGCLADRKDVQRKLKDKVALFFSINSINKFENWINKNYKLKIPKHCKYKKNSYLSLQPKYSNKLKICVPIMTGCNNFCSYCVVPYARGREWSRPIQDIIMEIENAKKNGCKEVLLLGQNVNSYRYKIDNSEFRIVNENIKTRTKKHPRFNCSKFLSQIPNSESKIKKDITITFPILLNLLATNFNKTRFSFLTSHPKDFSTELISVIAKHQNISRNIHLPAQSGSNKILAAMNRRYTQKHYSNIIKMIKNKIPKAKISTDVIVGFPGETSKDFQETVNLFKQVNFYDAFINKYSPRPGTTAEKFGNPISWNEKKQRERILRSFLRKKHQTLKKSL